jgi:hypothetical protein
VFARFGIDAVCPAQHLQHVAALVREVRRYFLISVI